MRAGRLALLVVCCDAFRVLVDLNAFTTYEIQELDRLPIGLDGVWEMTVNVHPGKVTDEDWKRAFDITTPSKFVIAEENPTDSTGTHCPYCECARLKRIIGRAPALTFGYHETGSQPHTALNRSEIEAYHRRCEAQVLTLTRWYGGDFKAQVQRVLNSSALAGFAMEFNPGDKHVGKRGEAAFVHDLLSAGKQVYFLMPPAQAGLQPFGRTQEANMNLTLSTWLAQGVPLQSSDVHLVVARYGLSVPCSKDNIPAWHNLSCVYGATDSVAAALRMALRFRDHLDQRATEMKPARTTTLHDDV